MCATLLNLLTTEFQMYYHKYRIKREEEFMKKKIVAMLSLVVCASIILSGCKSSTANATSELPTYNLTAFAEVSGGLEGGTISVLNEITDNGNIIVTKQQESTTLYGVYNLISGTMVEPYVTVEDIEFLDSVGTNDYIRIKTRNGEGTPIYSAKVVGGTEFYTGLNKIELKASAKNGKKYYEVWALETATESWYEQVEVSAKGKRTLMYNSKVTKGDNINKASQVPGLVSMFAGVFEEAESNNLKKFAKYTASQEGNKIVYYNMKSGKKVAEIDLTDLFTSSIYSTLFIGDWALIQQLSMVADNATEYTTEISGSKVVIITTAINLLNGKVKELDTDYFITENYGDSCIIGDKVYARGCFIEDKKVTPVQILEIDTNFKVKTVPYKYEEIIKLNKNYCLAYGESNTLLKNVKPDDSIVAKSNDYLDVYHILDNKGNIVIDIPVQVWGDPLNDSAVQYADFYIGNNACAIYNEARGVYDIMNFAGKVLATDIDDIYTYSNGYFSCVKTVENADGTSEEQIFALNEKNGETNQIASIKYDASKTPVKTTVKDVEYSKISFNSFSTSRELDACPETLFMAYNLTSSGKYDIFLFNALGDIVVTISECASTNISVKYFGEDYENIVVGTEDNRVYVYKNNFKSTI